MLERKEYLDALRRWRDKRAIKVITGVRRCGKTTLMKQFRDELLRDGIPEEYLITINLDDYSNLALQYPMKLHAYILDHVPSVGKAYVFLDEIQNVSDYPSMLKSLFLQRNLDLYLTCANANRLLEEVAMQIPGCYVTVNMLPLSFAEYAQWTDDQNDLSCKFRNYIEYGAFPYAVGLNGNQETIKEFLSGAYHTILLKEVVGRIKNAAPMILDRILYIVFSRIGSTISTNEISDALTSEGYKLDIRTVKKYMKALLDSYIIYQVKQYDICIKQPLKLHDKYYAVDMGLYTFLLGRSDNNTSRLLENVVYLELMRRGYRVYHGKVKELSVDFVAVNREATFYVQVAATVRDEKILRSKLRPLQCIHDNYPKLILTLDDDPDVDYAGIKRINALAWLVGTSDCG